METTDSRLAEIFHNCEVNGPVSSATIGAAEKTLGLNFPPSYRRFLELYGAASGPGFEINGLPEAPADPDESPSWSNVVQTTMRYRPDSLPQDSIIIAHDGMEFGYFLHCSKSDAQYEGPVIEWGPAHDGGKEFARDFLSFLRAWRG
jgi:hypothetical protein